MIDLKNIGMTRIASQYIKEKYTNFKQFVEVYNLNVDSKRFKCNKCNIFYHIDDFSFKKRTAKTSSFGLGYCKACVRVEKIKRRGKERNTDTLLTSKYIAFIKNHFDNKCAICENSENLHIDHFIPLAWNMNKTIKGNYIILCENCNSYIKRDSNYIDWINRYNNPSYEHKLNDILLWLAKENNMTLKEYKDFYWNVYNNKNQS